MSPATIVEGRQNPRDDIPRIPFGTYALVYTGTTNTLDGRSTPCIALRESNNNGGHYFISLETGRRIHSNKWVEMPITNTQINRVHELASSSDNILWIDELNDNYHSSTQGNEFGTASYAIAVNDSINSDDEVSLTDVTPINGNQDLESMQISSDNSVFTSSSSSHDDPNDSTYKGSEESNNSEGMSIIDSRDYTFNINNVLEPDESINQGVIEDFNVEIAEPMDTPSLQSDSSISGMDVPLTQLVHNRSLVPNADISDDDSSSTGDSIQLFQVQNSYEKALHVMFTQMSAHKGIKLFGQRAIAAMIKELKQLNDGVIPGNPVIAPIPFDELTAKDKKESLEAVNLIAIKRSGKIKGRTCANGSKKRKYLRDNKDDPSPTASLESIMTTLVIDAYEGRDIAIADVLGAYLHAKFPESKTVILRMTDIFVDIICEINDEYSKHIVYEINKKGKQIKCLYVRVLRALYGCLESAFLWYELYLNTLKKLGFKINPYDRCVANKMINGSQCTIVFYVDDNKISHIDKEVVSDVINDISKHFGELTVSRGTKHAFLGMDIEIKERKVYI